MTKSMCGYLVQLNSTDSASGWAVEFGVSPNCHDVGRDDDGEVLSFRRHSKQEGMSSRVAEMQPMRPVGTMAEVGPVIDTELKPETPVRGVYHVVVQRMRQLLQKNPTLGVVFRRKRILLIAGIASTVIIVLVLVVASPSKVASTSRSSGTEESMVSGGEAAPQNGSNDPQSASIDLVLSGAISGLGNMQGVSRSSVKSTITSRAGDIVLMEISVAKPTGLTAFATVLLQKAGTQWRMRQIVDERN